jgi:hypothetical protein
MSIIRKDGNIRPPEMAIHFHIGCTYGKEGILKRLAEKDYKIAIIDDVGIRPDGKDFHSYDCVFGFTFAEIVALIEQRTQESGLRFGQLTTWADGSVDLLNRLQIHFKKSPLTTLRGVSLRDKYAARLRLASHGETLPLVQLVDNPSEIPVIDTREFPLIVKPQDSMASRC